MPVIAISRGSLAGATLLAESVASELQIPCISRDIVVEAAHAAGISEAVLAEQMDRPPSFLARHSRERDVYLWHFRSALCQHAVAGSFAYHGHGGHLLLADIPNLIRVGVVAPMKFRIAAVMESQGLDPKAARTHIHRIDKYRDQWVRHLYGVDWQDSSFYDLIINLDTLDVEDACKLVTQTARLERFVSTEESRQKVADIALATRVTAELARGGELFLGRLELAAEANVLTIGGQARSKRARDNIRAAAERAIGETELRFQVTVASENTSWGFEHPGVH
jgi:cytidylate kinase